MLAYPTIYWQRYVTFKGKALINKYFKVTTVSFQNLASFCLINIIILPIKKRHYQTGRKYRKRKTRNRWKDKQVIILPKDLVMPYKIHNNFTKESIKESLQKNYKTVTEENLDISIVKLIGLTTTSTHTF